MDPSSQSSSTTTTDFNNRLTDRQSPVSLTRVLPEHPQRVELETYVRRAFARRYRARVHTLPASLMALRRVDGTLTAAAGLRFAARTPLFLEQYLDAPVERYLGSDERGAIVEIGSLAAPTPGQVRYLMIALTAYLHSAGYRWVVCTAINSLRNTLARMGLTPVVLGAADPARLGTAALDWGRYFEEHPRVIAGHLAEAASLLEARVVNNDGPVQALWRCARQWGQRDRIAPPASPNASFAAGIGA